MWENLHPPLTAFPLALGVSVLLLEVLNLAKPRQFLLHAILVNLALLALSILAAFFSGYSAAEHASRMFTVPEDQIAAHHSMGRLALFCTLPCVALRFILLKAKDRRREFAFVYGIFLITLVTLIVLTGYKGGSLIFDYGAGVRIVDSK